MNAHAAARPAALPIATRYEFRLYRGSEPGRLLGMRQLIKGSLTLGRDAESGWIINDPARVLSRRHCELFVRDDSLIIVAKGANGVSVDGELLPLEREVLLAVPCMLMLGDFLVDVAVAGKTGLGARAEAEKFALRDASSSEEPVAAVAQPATPIVGSGLLEAFCEGAGLDPSLLAGEEPEDILRRAGAIYRETVLGVSELMAERDRARGRYEMRRTMIGGTGNNLFKWASSQRLAIDLLLSGRAGFLPGPEAVRSSLSAIRHHIVAGQAGMQGYARAIVALFSPEAIDRSAVDKGSVLKSRAAAQAEALAQRHAQVTEQIEQAQGGTLDRAYVQAYDAAVVSARQAVESGNAPFSL